MIKRYMVTYDICHAKRPRKVFELLRGFGDHVQDQVLIIDLGLATGRGDACVPSVGRSYVPPENTSTVL